MFYFSCLIFCFFVLVIRDILQRIARQKRPVGVIATALAQSELHPVLSVAQGSQLFAHHYEIPLPNLVCNESVDSF